MKGFLQLGGWHAIEHPKAGVPFFVIFDDADIFAVFVAAFAVSVEVIVFGVLRKFHYPRTVLMCEEEKLVC